MGPTRIDPDRLLPLAARVTSAGSRGAAEFAALVLEVNDSTGAPARLRPASFPNLARQCVTLGVRVQAGLGQSLEDLAQLVDHERATLAAVNLGFWLGDPALLGSGEANGLAAICGVERETESKRVSGFRFVVPGRSAPATVGAADAARGWLDCGGGWLAAM